VSCNGNSLSNHYIVPVLYFTSIPVLLRKSAPKITSYLQESASNMSAYCWSTLQFLSSSGSLRLRNTTISDEVLEPASVLIFPLLEILHGWQFLGRHFLLIMVVVEPESNKTFSKILDFTVEMVSTTMIVTGESCFGIFLFKLIFIASLALFVLN
jgi:hypothetical protein